MDPEGIIWVRGLLRRLAAEGRAVLVSSHLLSELQGMADELIVIGRGRVLASGAVADLLSGAEAPTPDRTPQHATLEDLYLRLTSGEAEFRAGSDPKVQR
jgi:ABC-2 type transport system ATP-binding protein